MNMHERKEKIKIRGVQAVLWGCRKQKKKLGSSKRRTGSDPESGPENPNRFRVVYKGCNPNFLSFFTLHSFSSLVSHSKSSVLSLSYDSRIRRTQGYPARWPDGQGGLAAAPEFGFTHFFDFFSLILFISSPSFRF